MENISTAIKALFRGIDGERRDSVMLKGKWGCGM